MTCVVYEQERHQRLAERGGGVANFVSSTGSEMQNYVAPVASCRIPVSLMLLLLTLVHTRACCACLLSRWDPLVAVSTVPSLETALYGSCLATI